MKTVDGTDGLFYQPPDTLPRFDGHCAPGEFLITVFASEIAVFRGQQNQFQNPSIVVLFACLQLGAPKLVGIGRDKKSTVKQIFGETVQLSPEASAAQ